MLRVRDFKVLNCIIKLQQICTEGEGKIKLSDISFWTGLNRMAVHRSLVKMEKLKLVSRNKEEYKNHEVHYWKTEQLAHELERIKEMR